MKFNDALFKINLAVLTEYPVAQFYEAQGQLVPTDEESKVDGTIDTAQFKAIYNYPTEEGQKTIVGSFDDDLNVKIEVINDIWCEDVIMTPYVPMTADYAIDLINAKLDLVQIGPGPITLRHQLYPGENEPRYFIGTIKEIHSIKVYSAEIDADAGK